MIEGEVLAWVGIHSCKSVLTKPLQVKRRTKNELRLAVPIVTV